MRNSIMLFLCIGCVTNAFGAPTYNCQYQSGTASNDATLKFSDGNLICGHHGTDGCRDGTYVSVVDGIPDGHSDTIPIYKCDAHNRNDWQPIGAGIIRDCGTDELDQYLGEFDDSFVYVSFNGTGPELSDFCKIRADVAEDRCETSGGEWDNDKCDCSGSNSTLEKDGNLDISPCKCKSDLVLGSDLNGNNPNKCWPKPYLDRKCLQKRYSSEGWLCPDYPGKSGNHTETNPEYYFWRYTDKTCLCDDLVNNSRVCINGDRAEYRANCNCPGFSFDAVITAYDNNNVEWGTDDNGFECIKPKSQYNYLTCSSDSDCTDIDNTTRPYLHSTAWHCAYQTAGVKVCTATACDTGWAPKNGYCQEDKSATTSPKPTNEPVSATPQDDSKIPDTATDPVIKPTEKTPCSDPNMDSNCNCTKVPDTTKRNNKCECIDTNKVIQNGKCEYSAAYLAQLESEINTHYDSLHAIMSGLKVNVWRDADGNFNTARLASDSIAGVVLGTVGGIVTANLVKKSQVKQGFEDMKCSIGGQSVAGFGDEFTVGR